MPELSYDGLAIGDGAMACTQLEHLLFQGDCMEPAELAQLRKDLLAYCKLDTLAMVKLLEKQRTIATG